ncbi:MAG TPA: hypothetical protein VJH20_05910 [Candidatus Nanoarchaeia archaeon]|nr:hypothetical protein [Candidatus Nanoarchaeia archaeon]
MTPPIHVEFASVPRGLEKFLAQEGYIRTDNRPNAKEFKDFSRKGGGPSLYYDAFTCLRRIDVAVLLKIHYDNSNSLQLSYAYDLARKLMLRFNVTVFDPLTEIEITSREYRT